MALRTEDEEEGKKSSLMIPKARFDEINEKYQALQADITTLKAEAKAARTAAQKEQGEWKELAEERGVELAKLQDLPAELAKYQKALTDIKTAQLENIPEKYRGMLPESLSVLDQVQWISTNAPLLSKSASVDVKGKKGGSKVEGPELTAEELSIAKASGMSKEDYIKYRDMDNMPEPANGEGNQTEE